MSMTLRDSLARHTVAELKDLVSHLPGAGSAGRKDELVERIVGTLLGPGVQAIWSALDETQKAAVAEAVHHPRGEYSERCFRARYLRVPSFQVASAKSSGYSASKSSALALFLHYSPDESCYCVPTDLQARLQAFVLPPAPLSLQSSETLAEDESLTIRLTEREALQEVAVMLRTIEQARVLVSEKTSTPGTATLRLLSEKLAGGDFYPSVEKKERWGQEIGPIKAFAWPMLLQAGGLAVRVGTRLVISPAGIKGLSMPSAEVLRGLWRKWLKTTLFDEFSRVDTIKGQNSKGRVMTAAAPRRAPIEETLRDCPVGRWITFDDFSRFMRASDRHFEVTHDTWKLYLCERQYGSLGFNGSGGWNILQERYLLAVLFEYAATLGLVDVAYHDPADARNDFSDLWGTDELSFLSRYDGLTAFRVTPLGAYLLGLEAAYRPLAIVSSVALSVSPDLRVNVVAGALAAEEALLLESWAVAEHGGWRLDRDKALLAMEKGHAIAELKGFLASAHELPLPESVDSFLQFCERNGQALKTVGSAVLIECRDTDIADEIAGRRETGSLCLRAGPRMLVVRSDQVDKFRERVRLLGFGMMS
ncbi:conserved hypothetical protein [Candidatus Accumulibacter aalborgensis]|uniref:Helicase XPB/Ssl2 N-terminal domain-containing protein n=1 Tax=Candidatus Accumulibacter aalborgensis TaxID=1860102 RepID=A0A1A8XVK3_9PROT|nr:hypothetical protein [Candidatus Accumulibacter aalborgensis]SBT09060.1 conserved hypothetical protein [Candidatus Accumulibacter aalborgensis]